MTRSAVKVLIDSFSAVNDQYAVFTVVLKLLKMAKSVRSLLDTVVQALPEVGNLGLLFFLLFFIFAALGVELFGRVGNYCVFCFSRASLSPFWPYEKFRDIYLCQISTSLYFLYPRKHL